MRLPMRQKAGSAATKADNARLSLYFSSVICKANCRNQVHSTTRFFYYPPNRIYVISFAILFLLLFFGLISRLALKSVVAHLLLFFRQLPSKNCPGIELCKPLKCKSTDKTKWSYQCFGENNLLRTGGIITSCRYGSRQLPGLPRRNAAAVNRLLSPENPDFPVTTILDGHRAENVSR